jgi:hypothetical protein
VQLSTKEWLKPNLFHGEVEKPLEHGWKGEQLLQVRSLVTRSMVMVEAEGKLPEAVAKLRSIIDAIDAELTRDGD